MADNIRIKPSGRFEARLQIDGVRRARTFDTHAQAQRWLREAEAHAYPDELPPHVTVEVFAIRWMDGFAAAPVGTRQFHQGNLARYVLPTLGSVPLVKVRPLDITRLLGDVATRVSVATADAVYRTASALFNAAVADAVIARSPVRRRTHRPKRQREPPSVLERDQARALLAVLDGWQRDTALLQLSLGARIGEVAGLTPHDIDLLAAKVTIRRRVYRGTVRATKSHRLRTLLIPGVAMPSLRRLIDQRGQLPPIPDLGDGEHDAAPFTGRWLIQTSTGRPPTDSAFNKTLKAACSAARVAQVSSRGLRHTYVSWMLDEGHSADKVAMWIGDHPTTVHDVYAHNMLQASSAPAAASIDRALTGSD